MFITFDKMRITELGTVAVTSMTLHSLVCEYIQTKAGLDKLYSIWKFVQCHNHPNCFLKTQPIYIGYFFKQLIAFLPVKEKISFIWKILLKSKCLSNEQCHQPNLFFGIFAQVVMRNWTMRELKIGHDFLEAKSGQLKLLNVVLNSHEGSMRENEREVRSYYRSIYWTVVQERSKAKWLNLILKDQPYYFQSKLLLLLFSPIDANGNVVWDAFSNEPEDENNNYQVTINNALLQLGAAFRLLRCGNMISAQSILTLIDEVTEFSDDWLQKNMCQFIMNAGADILQLVLRRYLLCAQYRELISFVIQCTELPTYKAQVNLFSELIVLVIHEKNLTERVFIVELFSEFEHYSHLFPENRAIRVLLRALQRKFMLRKSKRLASRQ